MTEEIKKKISEEAEKYANDHTNGNDSIARMFRGASKAAFTEGVNFMYSLLQDLTRWRKVEEELPSEDGIYLVKTDKVRYAIAEYLGDYWVIDTNRYGVILRWKPID